MKKEKGEDEEDEVEVWWETKQRVTMILVRTKVEAYIGNAMTLR